MTGFTWEDPPRRKGKGVWVDRLAPLRERPGVWANFGKHCTSQVTRINHGQVAGIAAGEYEAFGADQKDGKCTLYVRYVGKPDLKVAPEEQVGA